jgi:hypothetical protein
VIKPGSYVVKELDEAAFEELKEKIKSGKIQSSVMTKDGTVITTQPK